MLQCGVYYDSITIQQHSPAEYQGRLSTGELPDDACQVVIQPPVKHELVLGGGVGAHHSAQLDWPHLLPIHLRLQASHTNQGELKMTTLLNLLLFQSKPTSNGKHAGWQ